MGFATNGELLTRLGGFLCLMDGTQSPAGATAYVSLEPCCHTGKKTPPCVPALIEARFAVSHGRLRGMSPSREELKEKTLECLGIRSQQVTEIAR